MDNEDDLDKTIKTYEILKALPHFADIRKSYPIEYYTYFINLHETTGPNEIISLDALLIEKQSNRVYTECTYNKTTGYTFDDIKNWVFYWIVEKSKLQGMDFSKQKDEAFEPKK